jgi:AcrR family transcriptional regulator
MPRRRNCRKRIVQVALRLFATRGYPATSIEDILRESGCGKGAMYYYFSSKEELGYAVIDEYVQLVAQRGVGRHLRGEEHLVDRLLKIFEDVPSTIELETGESFESGIGARMAAVHEGFRQRLATRLAPLVGGFERMVAKGIADGQIADSVNPRQLAHFATVVTYGLQMTRLLGQEQLMPDDARGWMKDYLNSLRK